MRNYLRENVARYREMTDRGVTAWAQSNYGGTDYADFSSRGFLEDSFRRAGGVRTSSPSTAAAGSVCSDPGSMICSHRPEC